MKQFEKAISTTVIHVKINIYKNNAFQIDNGGFYA